MIRSIYSTAWRFAIPYLSGKKFLVVFVISVFIPICKNFILYILFRGSTNDVAIVAFQEFLTGDIGYIVCTILGLNPYDIMPWDLISITKISILESVGASALLLLPAVT